jgi:hypothetical protein
MRVGNKRRVEKCEIFAVFPKKEYFKVESKEDVVCKKDQGL